MLAVVNKPKLKNQTCELQIMLCLDSHAYIIRSYNHEGSSRAKCSKWFLISLTKNASLKGNRPQFSSFPSQMKPATCMIHSKESKTNVHTS